MRDAVPGLVSKKGRTESFSLRFPDVLSNPLESQSVLREMSGNYLIQGEEIPVETLWLRQQVAIKAINAFCWQPLGQPGKYVRI
jgi:hypothetical protein